MKTQIVLLFTLILFGCKTSNCPTTDKKYFTKGIKKSKPLYKGYPSKKGNQSYSLTIKNRLPWNK